MSVHSAKTARDRPDGRRGIGGNSPNRPAWRRRLVPVSVALVGSIVMLTTAPALLTSSSAEERPVLSAPGIGDEGRYEVRSGGGVDTRFRWSEGRTIVDAFGRDRLVDRLELASTSGSSRPTARSQSLWWAQGLDTVVAMDETFVETSSVLGGGWRWEENSTVRSFTPPPDACLFSNRYQGRAMPTVMEFPAACFGLAETGAIVLHEYGNGVVQGVPALRFRNEAGIEVWYNPFIPYPLRIVDSEGIRELVSFVRGATPRAAPVPAGAPPAWVMAPRLHHGQEDRGIAHPFPLSEAFQLAQDDPGFPDLREFMAEHPDAYAAMAFYRVEHHPVGAVLAWHVVVSDGDDTLCVDVNRQVWVGAGAPAQIATHAFAAYPWPCEAGFVVAIMRSYGNGFLPSPVHGFPPPLQAPDRLPTVGSTLSHWERHVDGTQGDVGYGHAIMCATSPCDEVVAVLLSGEASFTMGPGFDNPAGAPALSVRSSILVQAAGSEAKLLSMSEDQSWAGPAVWGGSRTLDRAAAWHPPTPPSGALTVAIAATGALALLVALLELAASGGRWGPLALFSRLRRTKLEEHALRRLLLQVIEEEPGIHFSALRRTVGVGESTVQHHLRMLEAHGLVTSRRDGGYTCYFVGSPTALDARSAAVLRSKGARRFLAEVEALPGISLKGVAHRTGLSMGALQYHRRRLAERGLIVTVRHGRELRFKPAPRPPAAAGAPKREAGAS